MRHINVLTASLAALALACGSAGDPPRGAALPSGFLFGASYSPVEAAAYLGAPADCGGTFVSKALVVFSSRPSICSEMQSACYSFANASGVTIVLERVGTSPRAALGPATYAVGATPEANGQLLVYAYAGRTDSSCNSTGSSTATGGTVTIDTIDNAVRGSLDLVFPNGDGFAGAFAAPLCPGTYDTCNGDACTGAHVCVP